MTQTHTKTTKCLQRDTNPKKQRPLLCDEASNPLARVPLVLFLVFLSWPHPTRVGQQAKHPTPSVETLFEPDCSFVPTFVALGYQGDAKVKLHSYCPSSSDLCSTTFTAFVPFEPSIHPSMEFYTFCPFTSQREAEDEVVTGVGTKEGRTRPVERTAIALFRPDLSFPGSFFLARCVRPVCIHPARGQGRV
jgi:hypothetical protein